MVLGIISLFFIHMLKYYGLKVPFVIVNVNMPHVAYKVRASIKKIKILIDFYTFYSNKKHDFSKKKYFFINYTIKTTLERFHYTFLEASKQRRE